MIMGMICRACPVTHDSIRLVEGGDRLADNVEKQWLMRGVAP